MSRRRQTNRNFPELAAEQGPEDGLDPKAFHDDTGVNAKRAGRKALQLCGQVQWALTLALAGCGDEALLTLTVIDVTPAPHSGRLRVRVTTDPYTDRRTSAIALLRAYGGLRASVAQAIHRRYAPELVFDIV